MKTVLKVQLPLINIPLILVRNIEGTFYQFIDMNEEKELVNELLKDKEKSNLVCYCKCEVESGKIIKVLEHVSDLEFLLGDDSNGKSNCKI